MNQNRDPLKKKHSLHFETSKTREAKKTSAFLAAFISFVVIFGGLSIMLLILNSGGDVDKMIGIDKVKPTEETTVANDSQMILPEVSGSANFLFVIEDNNKLQMCAVVHADMDNLKLTVRILEPKDFQESYKTGGIQGLKSAVERAGVKIDRYALTTERGLRNILKATGNSVKINVPQKINVNTDELTLRLKAGEQDMTSALLYKYLICPAPNRAAQLKAQGDVLCAALDQLINEENLTQGEKLFGTVVNELNTDISVLDYIQNQSCLEVLVRSGERQKSETTDSFDKF